MIGRSVLTCAMLFASASSLSAQTAATKPDTTFVEGLPAGKGSLNQDQITLRFSVGALEIRFMPTAEGLLRLLAPDGYKAITALVASQQEVIDSIAKSRGVQQPGVALVTFNALAPNTRFEPKQFTLITSSRRMQPIGVIPLSPNFSNQQLAVREKAMGLLIFDRGVPSTETFSLKYLLVENVDWRLMIPRLEAERVRIIGQVKSDSIGALKRRP